LPRFDRNRITTETKAGGVSVTKAAKGHLWRREGDGEAQQESRLMRREAKARVYGLRYCAYCECFVHATLKSGSANGR
jgi:hypothetical protein